jgi:Ni,Fe-hydrogenase III large subunit
VSHDTGTGYHAKVADALGAGAVFAGLYASDGPDGPSVHTLVTHPDGEIERLSDTPRDGIVPTIVDLAPAAGWDEREARDLYGVAFDGHEPLRPLVDHDPEPGAWTVPVRGADPYQVAVGPIHAGIIESGHFRFHVVGERILHLDVRLFYKHRGLERAAEGAELDDGIRYAGRACGACAVSNRLAYALACEAALGLVTTPRLAHARTVLLELERLWSHLNDVGAICAGVGFAAGNARFAALTDDARTINQRLTGHRLLFETVRVGGTALDVPAESIAEARMDVERIRTEAEAAWRELVFNASLQDRLPGVGVLSPADAVALGATGPCARAAGIAGDVRCTSPNLLYDDFTPCMTDAAAGDVRARLEQRRAELAQTFELLDGLLRAPLEAGAAARCSAGAEAGFGRVESPRGATLCAIERSGTRLSRLHLRTGSYANWPVVAHVAPGNLLPDFPLINKSFELCYACADR